MTTVDLDELFGSIGFTADEVKLANLFGPATFKQRAAALTERRRFVHYTTASSAGAILGSRSVWLRNATTMNDYSEISFGIDHVVSCLGRRRDTETARKFWSLMEQLGDGLPEQITTAYDGWVNNLRLNTYLFSLSEHDASEDQIGRLSMWRAYGGDTGVAIVINGRSLHAVSDALGAYSYPVFYSDRDAADLHFDEVVSALVREKDYLASRPIEDLARWVFTMLCSYSICTKHPGFREEREWRVVYQPKQNPSGRMVVRKVDIRGHPQLVYELPLKDVPEEGLYGLEPNDLIERVIIGPTRFPIALFDYCCAVLRDAGVTEPEKRVFISHIPLRT